MLLVSVQTKLTTVLALAQQARNSSAYYVQRFGDGQPVQTQELVNLARQYREIATRAAVFAGDSAVSAEADRQFAGQPGWETGSLLVLLAGVSALIEQVISAAKAAAPSLTDGNKTVPILSVWNTDGTTTPAEVSAASVQSLRSLLSQIVVAIPE